MPDTTTRAREIRAELDKLAPYPDGEAVTARSLARWMAMEAQLAWARMTGMDHPVTMTDVAILQGNFAAAHALLAWAGQAGAYGAANADEAAVQIREAFDPPGIGEWLWEHLGDDAERIAELAEELAKATAPAEDGEVARLKAELSRVQSAAQTLGKIVTRQARMDAEVVRTACTEPHGPDMRCFDCATDAEMAAAIPPPPGGSDG